MENIFKIIPTLSLKRFGQGDAFFNHLPMGGNWSHGHRWDWLKRIIWEEGPKPNPLELKINWPGRWWPCKTENEQLEGQG